MVHADLKRIQLPIFDCPHYAFFTNRKQAIDNFPWKGSKNKSCQKAIAHPASYSGNCLSHSDRYEMYTSARERMAMMQHIWGLSFQDKSDCEEVSVLTTTLMQGMVGAYYLTEKYSNEIAKLRLKLECKDEATWNESQPEKYQRDLPEVAIKLAAVIENQSEKSTT